VNIPLSQLRRRYEELPTQRDIWICCGVGQRAYYATRFLSQHGYRAWNLPGGYATYVAMRDAGLTLTTA
jgi:rhodanese-related sulfurtransferase